MRRILKKNREIAPRSSNEGIRSQETVSTSETSSIFTKGKSKLHRFRTSILPNSIPKEVITHDERTGIVVHEQGQGQASELGGPANAATDEGLPALLQHGPTVVVAENAMVVVHQTFTASAHPSDVPVQQDKVPAIAISTVSGNDQVIQTGVNDMYDAEKKTLTIESIPRPAEYAVTAAGLADTAMTHLNTINATSLQPLTTFNKLVHGIANVHPYAQIALGLLATASNIILSQANLDASMMDLITRIKQTYELILKNPSSSMINSTNDLLVQIAQVIQECAHFVSRYSETKRFWARLGKNVFSETSSTVAQYNSKLDKLMQELRDRVALITQDSVQQIGLDVQQMRQDTSLDFLAYAGGVGLNQTKKCLDGTRSEILNEIIDWINNTDAAVPRIFWLHGQAGRGKSAIAHTIAQQAKNLSKFGSCFCFTRVRHHEALHVKLITTIARDLADCDLRFRLRLVGLIANDRALRDTEDIITQWQKFILEPFAQLGSLLTRNVVIIIDALDESGVATTREGILDIFATYGAELPANIRILLTSRPLADIREALCSKQHILSRSLDDVHPESATRDITLYISTKLKSLGIFCDADFDQLAAKSGGLFEWARLACDDIRPRVGVAPKERFHKITSHARGSPDVLSKFRSVMRQILWSKEPLTISAMDAMRREFSRKDDHYSVRIILNFMGSFLVGTTDTSTPVRPLHSSFYDFLLDQQRSGEFFLDQADVHYDLALSSLRVMQGSLRFNICSFPTSYLRNSDVVDLAKRIEENIPLHLLYSCRFWASHLQDVEYDYDLAHHLRAFVTEEQFLFWMETLGVSNFIGAAYRALISAEMWLEQNIKILWCGSRMGSSLSQTLLV
ncbi:hypothetical protein V8B97DRAFT_586408 [Scleroderma yunnanense]